MWWGRGEGMRITGWRDWLARTILSALAGRRVAFWISEESENTINEMHELGTAGCGAAIVMAHALADTDFNEVTFTLDRFEITVRKRLPPP